jgi:hypothetical protein
MALKNYPVPFSKVIFNKQAQSVRPSVHARIFPMQQQQILWGRSTVAEWLECLTPKAKVEIVLGPTQISSILQHIEI